MACSVLRCQDPSAHVERLSSRSLPVEVSFCSAHWAKVQDGAPWHVQYQHPEPGQMALAGKRVVLMGADMPMTYVDVGVRESVGSSDTVEATLTLKGGDGSHDVIQFLIPRDELRSFAGHLGLFAGGEDQARGGQ